MWGSGVRSHREAIFRIFRKSRGQERNHRAAMFRIFANHGGRRGVIGRRFSGFSRITGAGETPTRDLLQPGPKCNGLGLWSLAPESPQTLSPVVESGPRMCAFRFLTPLFVGDFLPLTTTIKRLETPRMTRFCWMAAAALWGLAKRGVDPRAPADRAFLHQLAEFGRQARGEAGPASLKGGSFAARHPSVLGQKSTPLLARPHTRCDPRGPQTLDSWSIILPQ